MKRLERGMTHLGIISFLLVGLLVSCAKKSTEAQAHELDVSFSHSPNPAVVGTPVTLLFEVEEEGEHVSVESPGCEVHAAGGEHEGDVELTEEEDGHYSGTHTFSAAGDYEVHFSFSHDGELEEHEFELMVQSP